MQKKKIHTIVANRVNYAIENNYINNLGGIYKLSANRLFKINKILG